MSDNDNFEDARAEPSPVDAADPAPSASQEPEKKNDKKEKKEKKPRAAASGSSGPAAAAKATKVAKEKSKEKVNTNTNTNTNADANANTAPKKSKSKPSAPVSAPAPEEKAMIAAARPDVPAVARARRWHPGTVARREIRRLQSSADIVMRHAPFERRMRYLMEAHATPGRNTHFSSDAIHLLEEAYQADCVSIFQDLVRNSCHGDRATVMEKDLSLWKHYMDKYTNIRTFAPSTPADVPLAITQ